MRRITEKQFVRKYVFAVAVPVLMILLAVFVLLSPVLLPEATYAELDKKEITVSELIRHHIFRVGTIYCIRTTEGEVYTLTGEYELSELKESLVPDAKAEILWYRNRFPFAPDLAEEVVVDGVVVVAYDNDKPVSWGGYISFASVLTLIAVVWLFVSLWNIKHLRKLQNDRDKRIKKKYGSDALNGINNF